MEPAEVQTVLEFDGFDGANINVDISIDLNAPDIPDRIVERRDKKHDETKPVPTSGRSRDALLREYEWAKREANRLGAKRYGCRCAIERLTLRIDRLVARRESLRMEIQRRDK